MCLSDSSDCPQYECVGRPAACDKNSVEPACDTDGLVHPSLCQLQQAGKTLAYMGHCQVSSTGEMELEDLFFFFGAVPAWEQKHIQPSARFKLKSTQSAVLHQGLIIFLVSCYFQGRRSARQRGGVNLVQLNGKGLNQISGFIFAVS